MSLINTGDLPDHLAHTINDESSKILLRLAIYDVKLRTVIAESVLLHCLYYAFPKEARDSVMESMAECSKITWEQWEKEDSL